MHSITPTGRKVFEMVRQAMQQRGQLRLTENESVHAVPLSRLWITLGVALLLSLTQPSLAGQLSLSTSPLFLGTSVEPNVFFLSDDSGSMDWDIMTLGNQGRIELVGADRTTTYSYVLPGADNN